MGRSSLLRWGAVGFVLFLLFLPAGCNRTKTAKEGKNPRVIVTTPITVAVVDYQDFTGRLDAVKTIDIRARVSGYVTEVTFKEGDIVKEGDVLFQIDDRPYAADLNQAEANYKLALADRNLQEKISDRSRKLYLANSISREDYDSALAAYEKSVASVGALAASRDKAKLYLDYTRVAWERDKQKESDSVARVPRTGRISRRFVDPGNLVLADNTVLTSVVTENPMYAYFDVDERTYLELLAYVAPGKKSWFEGLRFPVMMRLANEEAFEKEKVGVVDFVDNRVVATTGTVRMRGVFQNPTGFLKPGMFVRIRLPIGSPYRTIVIPDEALQSDQERKFVWVVDSDNKVQYRSVHLGQALGELRVIRPPAKGKEAKEGLTEDDRVIIVGIQRARKGITVEAENQPPPAVPDIPLLRLLSQ